MPYVREERLSVKQIKQILKSKNIDYSNVVEKRDLILLVEENVPTLTEAKEILNKKTSTSSSKPKNTNSTSNVFTKKRCEQMNRMTPAQMKQQAAMMRRNPGLVRRSNPQLATKSDAEIRQMADQLDMMAKNPEMFKRMQETMKNMTPEQMKAAQEMMNNMTPEQRAQAQQQFRNSTSSGTKTNSNNKLDLSNLGANMSDSQIEMMLNMLKTNRKGCIAMLRSQPALAKSLKGVSDEMLNKNLDMFANMNVTTVKRMIKVASTFQSVHRATGGYTLHICIAILALMFYLIWVYFFASSSADVVDFVSSGESEDTTSSVLIEELDESDEFDYDPFADE